MVTKRAAFADWMMTDEVRAFIDEWLSDLPYVIAHTSGSTGEPKEIRLLKEDMQASAEATNRYFGINSSSHLFLPLSASYIAGKMMIVRTITAGCRLTAVHPTNHLLDNDYGDIDLMAVVPSQCESLMANEYAHKHLRNMIVGGAPISAPLEKELLKMPWKTFATYGMTETCSHVALRPVGSDVYSALPEITFGVDYRGCLTIKSTRFSFNMLATNDIVELLSPEEFRWCGRYDNIINSGGIKLYPEQLEAILNRHFTFPLMVRGIEHPLWGTAPQIVAAPGRSEMPENLIQKIANVCATEFPMAARHSEILLVDSLPVTSNGKIKRNI